ncbi:hypothetical protein H310_08058 [Aphanomyces invadans]|uniref:Elongator complex protein 1 n=1 Tax=Aphanomyces invadans TaxID=157072 RepID=A0A024U0C5_9STRA|nr:hypothetical protein H310_08058 [Aphanomyces invadans]ETV99331.1 hypothetical protein H310_08058 [Aphanomyces invadans]|eukprot:XP_008871887.1 hypothetical protein H310_08058 [Aphanomyces invadans]
MRNLVVQAESACHVPAGASHWTDMSFDPAEERMWCVSSSGQLVGVVDGNIVIEVDLPASERDWSWCAFHAELDSVVCGSRSGTLVSVQCSDQHVELIGHFDFGIRGMAWSPNEEQLALVTGDGQFITFSATWNVLHESSCACGPIEETIQLSWRADGKFLAIQGPLSSTEGQSLQVWAVENAMWTLHGTGRHEDKRQLALQGSGFHWCPNQTLIASSEVFKGQLHVVFFERNGLRHGEFPLDSTGLFTVTHLAWNMASDVLAVVISPTSNATPTNGPTPSITPTTVQLWTRSNYHWSLKQSRQLTSPVAALQWDLEQPYVLHALQTTGAFHSLSVSWHVCANAAATVAVIDGRHVKVTHCATALIPPPMCAASIEFAHAINATVLLNNDTLVAHDVDGRWYVLSAPWIDKPQPLLLVGADDESRPWLLRHLQAVDNSTVTGILRSKPSQIATINIATGSVATTDHAEDISTVSTDGHHVQLAASKAIVPGIGVVQTLHILWTKWVVLGSDLVVALARSKLYVNATLLHASVESFDITATGFLVLTTLGSKAEFHVYQLEAVRDGRVDPVHTRPMERGAMVVTTTDTDVVLQMQRGNLEGISPRPLLLALLRSLLVRQDYAPALELCRKHRIDMNVLVDVNPGTFLAHIPEWIEAIPKRSCVDRLCLFVTNLHPTDVCATKFPALQGLNSAVMDPAWDKVVQVCTALRTVMAELNHDFYMLALLTCDAKLLDLDAALQRLQVLHAKDPVAAQKGLKHLVFLVDVEELYDVALGLYDIALTRLVAQHTERDPKEYTPQLAQFEALASLHSPSYMRYAIDMSLQRFDRALQHLHAAGPAHREDCLEFVKTYHLYDQGLALFTTADDRKPILTAYGHYLMGQSQYSQAGFTFLSVRATEEAVEAFKKAHDWQMALTLAPQVPTLNVVTVAYALAEELVNRNNPNPKDAARILIEYCHDVDEGIATLLSGRLYADALHMAALHNRLDLIETDVQPAVEQAAMEVEEDFEVKMSTYQTHWTRLTTLREQIRLFRLHGIDGKADEDDHDGGKDSASSAAASAFSRSSSASSVGSHNSNRDIKFGLSDNLTSLGAAVTSSYYVGGSSAAGASEKTVARKKMPRRFRRAKIQEGSAEEDAYVQQCLFAAVPTPDELKDVKALLQLLVYFGEVKWVVSIQATIQRCLTHMAAHPPPLPVHGEAVPFVVPAVDDSWLVLPLSMG